MIRRRTVWLLLLLAVALMAWQTVRVNLVVGESMAPTLKPWDLCLSLRTRSYEPRRGEIVSFRTSDDPPLYFVKRVVGLPGETLSLQAGVVSINGSALPEPYTKTNPSWSLAPTAIPEGKIYVLSDNRRAMFQDYVQGMVATRLVNGRILWHWRWGTNK